ncbi:MAG: hypothetical protein AAF664_19145 [Planctomycetota bacterium]
MPRYCIRELWLELSMKHQTLAVQVHVARQTIAALEAGGKTPSLAIAMNCEGFRLIRRRDFLAWIVDFVFQSAAITNDVLMQSRGTRFRYSSARAGAI